MPERPIPPELVRQLREAFGLSTRDVARVLRIGKSSVYRFEEAGAPPWMLLALGGLGVIRYGRSVSEMAALMGIDPDAPLPTTASGSYAPVLPEKSAPVAVEDPDSDR